MSSERGLWHALRRGMGPLARLVRVENAAGPGTPDVYYRLRTAEAGWLELKELDGWPLRPTTPLRLPKLTLEQVMWIEAEVEAGGTAHVLLQVGSDRLLLSAGVIRGVYDRALTRETVLSASKLVGRNRLDCSLLISALRRPRAVNIAGSTR